LVQLKENLPWEGLVFVFIGFLLLLLFIIIIWNKKGISWQLGIWNILAFF